DGLLLGFAHAGAFGIYQDASNASRALVSLTNGLTVNGSGAVINVSANASAHGATTSGGGHLVNVFDVALASVGNPGNFAISQNATGNGVPTAVASANISNQGTINLKAHANATALGSALAEAEVFGIFQSAGWQAGSANIGLVNATGAVISETAKATALATGAFGGAGAGAIAVGIVQSGSAWSTVFGTGTAAHVHLTNAGEINVAAVASAVASSIAIAIAEAAGIQQSAFAGFTATAQLFNSSNIHVSANAAASAFFFAEAEAIALGIAQTADGASFTSSLANVLAVNKDTITVEAHAFASASFEGIAIAEPVFGVFQSAYGADFAGAEFVNGTTSGTTPHPDARLHVSGTAFAAGSIAEAFV
ncbi:MAG: hypothetical protein ACREMY_25925, partial [bacterium]